MNDTTRNALIVDGLAVRYGDKSVLQDVALDVDAGRTLTVIGSSGCGKTTLLRTIAGLVPQLRGRIMLGADRIDHLPAHRRGIVYLNQEPLLFPHLNVFENIAFGLRLRHLSHRAIRERVNALITQLELDGLADRQPHTLSGGQRQRAAFGRALIVAPSLLLLDEPFSNLDPETRTSMQFLFKALAHDRAITSIFVTHDLKESLRIGDRFAILHAGGLHHYRDRAAFCVDPTSGVRQEAEFWSDLAHGRWDAPVETANRTREGIFGDASASDQ